MRGVHRDRSGGGLHRTRCEDGRIFRGTAKRIRRIRWRDNTSWEFLVFVVAGILMILALMAWGIAHPADSHQRGVALDHR